MDQQQAVALCGMEESLCRLIGLYCMQHPSEQKITDWFSGIEFEMLRPEASCMAAAMAAANDYKGTPFDLVPRLRGIIRYVHTLNSGMTAGLYALGKRFNEAGIPAVLLGSTAVHLRYPEPPQRHLWQTELSVSEADFSRAVALAEQAGFTVEQTPYSATARRGNTQRVLIRKGTEYAQGATELTINGVSFLMPCSAALFANLAESVFQALSGTGSGAKLIPWIMDLHCVIASTADWNAVAAAAAERETAGQVRLVLELYHALAPDLLTEEILALFGSGDHTARLAQLLLKYRKHNAANSKLKRLWIHAQIKSEGSPSGALGRFLAALWQTALRKLTPGN